MQPSTASLRDLSIVDDHKLRRDMFSASENLLKKIHKLEKEHADFLSWDQFMYQDWYNVTFRQELQKGEELEKRHRSLSSFQIHLTHLSQTSKVSLEQAYKMLKEEEAQYQAGDEGWRYVIENLRQQRYEAATRPANFHPPLTGPGKKPSEQFVKEVILNLSDLLHSDDSALSGLRRYARSIYHYLSEIDDAMMGRHLADLSAGYQLFKESFQIAMKCADWELLGRIWKTGGPAYQQKLLKPMPAHLKVFLKQMFADHGLDAASNADATEAETILRSSHRKLARLLHPDHQQAGTSEEFKAWATKKREKAQALYEARDHAALKRLEVICMAELGHLNNLTLDEIYQSSLALADELEALKKSLKLYRKHPAWKFSTRIKFEALTAKTRQDLKERIAPLEAQVRSLELFLNSLDPQNTSI